MEKKECNFSEMLGMHVWKSHSFNPKHFYCIYCGLEEIVEKVENRSESKGIKECSTYMKTVN